MKGPGAGPGSTYSHTNQGKCLPKNEGRGRSGACVYHLATEAAELLAEIPKNRPFKRYFKKKIRSQKVKLGPKNKNRAISGFVEKIRAVTALRTVGAKLKKSNQICLVHILL